MPEGIMPEGMPIPGKTKPTERQVRRAELGKSQDWRFPEKRFEKGKDHPGIIICPRCHAISEQKRWYLDERRYRDLEHIKGVQKVLCGGCKRVKQKIYEGEVLLKSPLLLFRKDEALALIRNTEREAHLENPLAQVASIEERDDEIYVLTTTAFLAERIGKEFHKTLQGELTIDTPPYEKFARVRWVRES